MKGHLLNMSRYFLLLIIVAFQACIDVDPCPMPSDDIRIQTDFEWIDCDIFVPNIVFPESDSVHHFGVFVNHFTEDLIVDSIRVKLFDSYSQILHQSSVLNQIDNFIHFWDGYWDDHIFLNKAFFEVKIWFSGNHHLFIDGYIKASQCEQVSDCNGGNSSNFLEYRTAAQYLITSSGCNFECDYIPCP